MSWDLVSTFLVLTEHLHYGAAAERLGISRQALSKRVGRLESQVGVPLVVRSTRRVELTRAGTTLRDEAVPALDAMRQAIERARAHGPAQALSVGISTDLTESWAAQVEAWVQRRGTPAVLERRAPDDALDLVRRGRLDLVLVAGEPPDLPGATVGHEQAVVVFPAEHRAAGQQAIRPGDLGDLVVAVSDAGDAHHHRAVVEQLHGDPELPYLIVPSIGTIIQGLVHAARTHRTATLALQRAVERADLSGLAVLPMEPPLLVPITLIARAGLPLEPLHALTDHLLALPSPAAPRA